MTEDENNHDENTGPKIGRPRSEPEKLRDQKLTIYLTEGETVTIKHEAECLGIPTATHARNIIGAGLTQDKTS